MMAKLPSTLPVGVEPALRLSSACSPSLPRKLVRWVGRRRRCDACTHQWLGGIISGLIHSRSCAVCHEFINEHDDEFVREVLKYDNADLLQEVVTESQVCSGLPRVSCSSNDPSAPTFLIATNVQGHTMLEFAESTQYS